MFNSRLGSKCVRSWAVPAATAGREVRGLGGKGEGIGKCRLAVIKQSQGCEGQHKEYTQSQCNNLTWSWEGAGNIGGTL